MCVQVSPSPAMQSQQLLNVLKESHSISGSEAPAKWVYVNSQ